MTPATHHQVGISIGLRYSTAPAEADGLSIASQEWITLDMPAVPTVGRKEMRTALADAQILASLLEEQPDEIAALVNGALQGRIAEAKERATRVGLTEEEFQRRGGGKVYWLYIAAVAGVIYACALTEGCEHRQ